MKEGRIHWHAVKLEVVNRSQRTRDRPKCDELQSIMTGSGIVKAGDHRGRSLVVESPIYIHSSKALFTPITLFSLMFLSSAYLKD